MRRLAFAAVVLLILGFGIVQSGGTRVRPLPTVGTSLSPSSSSPLVSQTGYWCWTGNAIPDPHPSRYNGTSDQPCTRQQLANFCEYGLQQGVKEPYCP